MKQMIAEFLGGLFIGIGTIAFMYRGDTWGVIALWAAYFICMIRLYSLNYDAGYLFCIMPDKFEAVIAMVRVLIDNVLGVLTAPLVLYPLMDKGFTEIMYFTTLNTPVWVLILQSIVVGMLFGANVMLCRDENRVVKGLLLVLPVIAVTKLGMPFAPMYIIAKAVTQTPLIGMDSIFIITLGNMLGAVILGYCDYGRILYPISIEEDENEDGANEC